MADLKRKLLESETNDLNLPSTEKISGKPKKEIRIWLDGHIVDIRCRKL